MLGNRRHDWAQNYSVTRLRRVCIEMSETVCVSLAPSPTVPSNFEQIYRWTLSHLSGVGQTAAPPNDIIDQLDAAGSDEGGFVAEMGRLNVSESRAMPVVWAPPATGLDRG